MTAETAFLTDLAARLAASGLVPSPALVGTALPSGAAELPALVLSLDEVRRQGAGLGERASLVSGALAVTARIDLANPVLPEEPTFRLLSADRLSLVLPHGGWVKADGSEGFMASADLQVNVAGAARTVVNAPPGATEVRPDAAIGTLVFGAPLPAAGFVEATYFVGQWERRVQPIAGVLVVDVRANSAADTQALSDALLEVLDSAAGRPAGLRTLAPLSLGAVGRADPTLAGSRGRLLRLAYEYQHIVDRPDSSGGVIRRVPITSHLLATSVEPASGALITTLFTETTETSP
ncbi:conserved hypothetical protein [Rubrivivax sp. A210]|uniref:hypothetical protein n=1 Tax=Rubrivivax sp. A210 TaxID=2772301 RepID=UPI0019181B29|nr:hypothetical protein [Rubrivivax sp. A210]CAD5366046.1 conserved hypothetical protein [Rubrivivax sp. A210]